MSSHRSPYKEFRCGPVFRDSVIKRSNLEKQDRRRCIAAALDFFEEGPPGRPAFDFKSLGSGPRHNLHSIRASQELRIILAIEDDIYMVANAGHHDAMHDWAGRRQYYIDPAEGCCLIGPGSDSDVAPILDLFEKKREGDFQDWMLFVDPEQKSLIDITWNGPALIRGVSGTGKTVIALHRAKRLANKYPEERILFTARSNTLCKILSEHYRALPNVPDNVEFVNIDELAYNLSNRQWVDYLQEDKAFEVAYSRVIKGSALERFDPGYLREEIERVIKGRGVQRAAEYLDTDRFQRLGRKSRFTQAMRALVWALHEAWDHELRIRNTSTHMDNRLRGRDMAQRLSKGLYRCAIVDEAQDMTLVDMQLIRALVAGAETKCVQDDGVLLLMDGEQQIYAGGYRPRWAKLDIGIRSRTLTKNYRNAQAIFEAAHAILGDQRVPGDSGRDPASFEFRLPGGEPPQFVQMKPHQEVQFIAEEIQKLIRDEEYTPEEIGILALSNEDANSLARELRKTHCIECVNVRAARTNDLAHGVRVCSLDQSKGLEFRAVFILGLSQTQFPRVPEIPEPAKEARRTEFGMTSQTLEAAGTEARLLELKRLHVAMTRARDRLYMLADGEPCPEIQKVIGGDRISRRSYVPGPAEG